VISAEAAFANAANAAAAAFAATPPYIAYRLEVRTRDDAGEHMEAQRIVLRTSDGMGLIREGERTQRALPAGLPPAVDALAQWAFSASLVEGHVAMRIAYERPKAYAFPTPGPQADVVAANIAGYSVQYVEDDRNHVRLAPVTPALRAFAAEPDHFVYRDVFIDPKTSLPTRVVLAAPDEMLVLDYATVEGRWLLSHFNYDATLRGAHAGKQHYLVEAAYSDYAFPSSPPAL